MSDSTTLKIEGMHCDGCVRRVRAALQAVNGINVRMCGLAAPTSRRMRAALAWRVRSMPLTTSASQHTSTEVGSAPSVKTEKITFPVTGMTCAACQAFLEKTLAKQPGVEDAAVNLMLHS